MKYTYPVEEYVKRYIEYLEMEKIAFNKDDSKEVVLKKLEENAKKELVMAEISNTMINEYIKPFENHIDDMTEEDAKTLQAFLDSFDVKLERRNSGAVDYSIVLLIARILIKYYRKVGDFNKYLTAVRRSNVGYTVTYLNHGYIYEGEHPNYEYIMDIANHANDNNGEYKAAILACVINVLYRTTSSYPLDLYIKIKDFVFTHAVDMPNPELYEFHYLLRGLEYFREYLIVNKKKNIHVDIEPYKPFLRELIEKTKMVLGTGKLDPFNAISLRTNLLITRFFLGEITDKETLEGLDAIRAEGESSENTFASFNSLCFGNHLYLAFLYWFSNYSREEINKISKNKIEECLPKITSFAKATNDININYVLVSFIQGASLTCTFEEFKDLILKSTVYADKALFIHTEMVKEMAGVIFDYLIEHNPSFFEGVCGKNVQYIIENKSEMKELLSECCMYHDIGKFYMIDIVENSMRKLTDDEFEVIKKHPSLFDEIYVAKEEDNERIRCIRDVAHEHHLWHDGTKGYPKEFEQTTNRPFTDIVAVVDSIDAATDFLGRPYNAGKSLDQLIDEFEASAGTQYGKVVCDALRVKEVKDKIEYWTKEGREEIYYRVYTGKEI